MYSCVGNIIDKQHVIIEYSVCSLQEAIKSYLSHLGYQVGFKHEFPDPTTTFLTKTWNFYSHASWAVVTPLSGVVIQSGFYYLLGLG